MIKPFSCLIEVPLAAMLLATAMSGSSRAEIATHLAGDFAAVANNGSYFASPSTIVTNLGVGTAVRKAASDNTKATDASVAGSYGVGGQFAANDANGTIVSGGEPLLRGNLIRNPAMILDPIYNGGAKTINMGDDTCDPFGGQQNVVSGWFVAGQYDIGPTATATITDGSPVMSSIVFTGIYAGYNATTVLHGGSAPSWPVSTSSGFPLAGGTVVAIVDSTTQVRLDRNQTVSGGGSHTINVIFGGGCNHDPVVSYPLPPVVTAHQIAVSDLPGIPNALQMDVTTGSTNTGHQSFLGIAQFLKARTTAILAQGTVVALPVSIGLWIKPNRGGNAGLSFQSPGPLGSRQYFNMCKLTANIWSFCTLLVPGDTQTTSNTCSGNTYTSAQTWPTSGNANDNYAVVAINFMLGSDFIGPANTWECFYAGDDTQTPFSITTGFSAQVTGVQLVAGNVLPPFAMPRFAEVLKEAELFEETSYPLGTSIGSNINAGMSSYIGAVSARAPGGHNQDFRTRKACASPTVILYSPVTGAAGKARDFNAASGVGADVTARIVSVSDHGFVWDTPPSGGSASANLGVQWTATCPD